MTDAATAERARIAQALRSGPRVTPSQRNSWVGTPSVGSRWTVEQIAKIEAEARDPDTVRTCEVPLTIENRTDWKGPPEHIRILCPMLAKTRTGKRALIISPAGDKLWMDVA